MTSFFHIDNLTILSCLHIEVNLDLVQDEAVGFICFNPKVCCLYCRVSNATVPVGRTGLIYQPTVVSKQETEVISHCAHFIVSDYD